MPETQTKGDLRVLGNQSLMFRGKPGLCVPERKRETMRAKKGHILGTHSRETKCGISYQDHAVTYPRESMMPLLRLKHNRLSQLMNISYNGLVTTGHAFLGPSGRRVSTLNPQFPSSRWLLQRHHDILGLQNVPPISMRG